MPKKFLIFLPLLISLIFFSFPNITQAETATLYFSPASGTFKQGESFWISIMVDTKGEAVNAVAAYFSYPQDKLEALGVSTTGSVMTIWAEKNAKDGTVEIAGGLPTPGFSGIKKIASVGFKVKVASGSVNFKFSQDSAVLRDSDNQNILNLNTSGQGNYSFKPQPTPSAPPTQPPVEPQPPVISEIKVEAVTQNEVTISWKTDEATDSVIEYGLTTDYGFSVSKEELTREHSIMISGLLPGTSYHFKIKSKTAQNKESETKDFTFSTLGYQVEIKVLNAANNQPLVGAAVIFSGPPELTKITNQEGKVVFDYLPPRKLWISVKYKDTSRNYPVEVLAKEELQSFEIKFELPLLKTIQIILFGLSALIIILSLFVIFTSLKRKPTNKVLIYLGILGILIAVAIIIIISPFGQQFFASIRDSQRLTHLGVILDAIERNISDNKGTFTCPAGPIPATPTNIGSASGGYDICDCIVPNYISEIPHDPLSPDAFYNSCSDYNSDYQISRDPFSGRINLIAPLTEVQETISLTR